MTHDDEPSTIYIYIYLFSCSFLFSRISYLIWDQVAFCSCKQTGFRGLLATVICSLTISLFLCCHSFCSHWSRALICLEVLSSFKCLVVYLGERKKLLGHACSAHFSFLSMYSWEVLYCTITSVHSTVPPRCWKAVLSTPWCSPSSAKAHTHECKNTALKERSPLSVPHPWLWSWTPTHTHAKKAYVNNHKTL